MVDSLRRHDSRYGGELCLSCEVPGGNSDQILPHVDKMPGALDKQAEETCGENRRAEYAEQLTKRAKLEY